jgi:Zn-dependent metalloprotease
MSRTKGLFLSIAISGAALLFPVAGLAAGGGPMARDVEIRFRDAKQGKPTQAGGRPQVDPLAAAANALEVHRDAFGRGPQDGFAFRLEEKDGLGQSHVRMTQTYRGIPVLGGELIVHVDQDGLFAINGRFVSDLDVPAIAPLAPTQAAGAATDWIRRAGGANVEVVDVLDPVIWGLDGEPVLTVPIRAMWAENEDLRFEDVYVDAVKGSVVGSLSRIYTAKNRKI